MVRSMMNLTTLPLSFWDYALESATRILNMVPTKKVDKTPYELNLEAELRVDCYCNAGFEMDIDDMKSQT
ncbi:hypothetical protein Tco_0891469 [Tanacetum coccineum]|uniref:Retrotransposon protein, putative, Ty1-copia subclass n=1 Tax=Tanacetum coccineum TaxID=301880 RepID=A0ABQ5C524_9ASTR